MSLQRSSTIHRTEPLAVETFYSFIKLIKNNWNTQRHVYGKLFFLIIGLAVFAQPVWSCTCGSRALIGRTKADMRTQAVAISSYQLNQGAYPLAVGEFTISHELPYEGKERLSDPFKVRMISKRIFKPIHHILISLTISVIILGWLLRKKGPLGDLENRRVRMIRSAIIGLSTLFFPMIILSIFLTPCYCPEVIKPIKNPDHSKLNFGYQNLGSGFILQSNGPDGDIDFDGILIDQKIEFEKEILTEKLKPFVYDSSNGSISDGDIIRYSGQPL